MVSAEGRLHEIRLEKSLFSATFLGAASLVD